MNPLQHWRIQIRDDPRDLIGLLRLLSRVLHLLAGLLRGGLNALDGLLGLLLGQDVGLGLGFSLGSGFSLALVGVGYLVGIGACLALLTGVVIAWGVAVPLLTALGPASGLDPGAAAKDAAAYNLLVIALRHAFPDFWDAEAWSVAPTV